MAHSTQAGFDDPFFEGAGFGGGSGGFGGGFGGFGGDFDDFRRQAEGGFRRYVKGWSPFGKDSSISRNRYR